MGGGVPRPRHGARVVNVMLQRNITKIEYRVPK